MAQKLAIDGGPPAVRRPLGRSMATEPKRSCVIAFLDSGKPLSGFHGSAQPTFFGGEQVRAFEDEWKQRFGVRPCRDRQFRDIGLDRRDGGVALDRATKSSPPHTR